MISQNTLNKTNVDQRISINKVTNLDRVNTYNNPTLEDRQGHNQTVTNEILNLTNLFKSISSKV